jgi:hypothetical protein
MVVLTVIRAAGRKGMRNGIMLLKAILHQLPIVEAYL